jgi:hypothetical protein
MKLNDIAYPTSALDYNDGLELVVLNCYWCLLRTHISKNEDKIAVIDFVRSRDTSLDNDID